MDPTGFEEEYAALGARIHRRRVYVFFTIIVVVTVVLFWLRFSFQNESPRAGETTRIDVPTQTFDVEVRGTIVNPDVGGPQ